jgi:hypothetical protein
MPNVEPTNLVRLCVALLLVAFPSEFHEFHGEGIHETVGTGNTNRH